MYDLNPDADNIKLEWIKGSWLIREPKQYDIDKFNEVLAVLDKANIIGDVDMQKLVINKLRWKNDDK